MACVFSPTIDIKWCCAMCHKVRRRTGFVCPCVPLLWHAPQFVSQPKHSCSIDKADFKWLLIANMDQNLMNRNELKLFRSNIKIEKAGFFRQINDGANCIFLNWFFREIDWWKFCFKFYKLIWRKNFAWHCSEFLVFHTVRKMRICKISVKSTFLLQQLFCDLISRNIFYQEELDFVPWKSSW